MYKVTYGECDIFYNNYIDAVKKWAFDIIMIPDGVYNVSIREVEEGD